MPLEKRNKTKINKVNGYYTGNSCYNGTTFRSYYYLFEQLHQKLKIFHCFCLLFKHQLFRFISLHSYKIDVNNTIIYVN